MKTTHFMLGAALFASSALCWSVPLTNIQSQSPIGPDITPAETPFILVELSGSLNAKKLKPGDTVKALVAQDVVARGRVVIPMDSKLTGHVTEAKALEGNENAESRLGIVFDKVVLKRHEEMSFRGVVHALAPPVQRLSLVDMPDPMLPQITDRQSSTLTPLGRNPNRQQVGPTGPIGSTQGSGIIPSQPMPTTQKAQAEHAPGSSSGSSSLSVGTRKGVFGLKGLSLTTEAANSISGPVIVSKVGNVKLDYGTQVLLRITEVPPHP